MTYAPLESSVAEGRPYFLYQFVEGDQVWRFTSRSTPWTSAGSGGTEVTWEPAAVAHGDVVQTSEIERGRLELTWPLSHPFARRFLAPLGNTPVTLTIFRGHEQVLGETVAHWKGRVVGAEVEGQRILLQAESIFSTLRRAGVRAKYQRLCRHALRRGRQSGDGLVVPSAVLVAHVVAQPLHVLPDQVPQLRLGHGLVQRLAEAGQPAVDLGVARRAAVGRLCRHPAQLARHGTDRAQRWIAA